MEAIFQRQHGRLEMDMVRRNDADEVHAFALWEFALGRYHLAVASVNAVGGKIERLAALLGSPGVGTERAAHQFDLTIHRSRDAVYFADEGAFPPADHSHPEFAIDWITDHSSAYFVVNDTLLSLALFVIAEYTNLAKNSMNEKNRAYCYKDFATAAPRPLQCVKNG